MPDNQFPPGGIADQILNNGGFPRVASSGDPSAIDTQPKDYSSVYNNFIASIKSGGSNLPTISSVPTILPGQVDTTGRFPKQLIGEDNEDIYARNQSLWNKIGNDTLKMLGIASTTFLQGTVGAVVGVRDMINGGSFFNNEFNQTLTDWSNNLENKLPNYYTAKERDGNWYEPSNLFSANFFFDKIMKNLGFAVGAAASGGVWGLAFKGIGLTTGLVRAGQNLERVAATMETELAAVPQAQRAAKALELLNAAKSGTLSLAGKALTRSDRFLAAAMGTLGESSIEALNNLNEYRTDLISQYEQQYGYKPSGEDLEEINRAAEQVGNSTFGLNAALLTVSNYIQFPRILNSSYRADKAIINGIETSPLVQTAQGITTNFATKSAFGKLLYKARNVGSLFFNSTEGAEEIGQYAIQLGTQDYFNRRRRGEQVSFEDAIGNALSLANSKEGWEQFVIGALSGGIMTSGILPTSRIPGVKNILGGQSQIKERGFTGTGGERAQATSEAITALNKTSFEKALNDRLKSNQRASIAQDKRITAVRQGDILEAKDEEQNYIYEYLSSRIKYGKFDFVKQDIDNARAQAATEESFEQLKAEGQVDPNETRQQYLARINNLEQHAVHMKSLYEGLNTRLGGVVNEKGERVYTPEVIDKMVYAASKVKDYDSRIPQLSSSLLDKGISVQPAIDHAVNPTEETKDTLLQAIQQIDGLNILPDEKETLKQNLQDVIEITLRRAEFVKEYGDILKTPSKYQDKKEVPVQPGAPKQQKIKVTTKDGEEELEVGTEYYLGKVVEHDKNGNEVYRFPKLTILGENGDGTIKIQDSNGNVKDVSKDVLADYKLGKVSDTKNNKTANFYLNHINDVYQYNFGKDFGGKRRGRLQYDPKEDKLYFVYKDSKGNIKRKEIDNSHFTPQGEFKDARLKKVGTLSAETAEQKKAREEFIAEKRAQRIEKSRDNRIQIVKELIQETNERIEEVNKKIIDRKEQLQKLNEQLEEHRLGRTVDKYGTTLVVPWEKTLKRAVKGLTELSNLAKNTEDEIAQLEAEKEELEFNLNYFQDFAQNASELPDTAPELMQELNNQVSSLEDLMLQKGQQINALSKFLDSLRDAIKSLTSLLKDIFKKLDTYSPEMKETLDRVKGATTVSYQDIATVKEYASDVSLQEEAERDIEINREKAKEVSDNIDKLYKEIQEVEKEYKAVSQITKRFQSILDDYNKRQEVKKKYEGDQKMHDALFKAQQEAFGEEPSSPSQEAVDKAKDIAERGKQKRITHLFTSTATTSREKEENWEEKPHLGRTERFLNRLGLGEIPVENLQVMVINQANQKEAGLEGLVEHVSPDQDHKDPVKGVLLYVYVRKTDSGYQYINEKGEDIGAIGQAVNKEEVVFSYAPSATLQGKNFYATKEDAQPKSYEQAWAEKRKEYMSLSGNNTQFITIDGLSRGIAQKDVENNTYKETNPITALIPEERLKSEQVVFVTTDNEVTDDLGNSVTFGKGKTVVKLGSTIEYADNRRLIDDEATTVFKVIKELARRWDETRKLDPTLTSWLQSIVFWYAPKDKNEKPKGHQVFVRDSMLHLGVNNQTILFHPDFIEENADLLLTFLKGNTAGQGTWHHVSKKQLDNFNSPEKKEYIQITGVRADGTLETKTWPSYQEYLVFSENPVITTHIRKVTGPQDANIRGRYVKLGIELQLPKEPAKPVKQEPKKEEKKEAPKPVATVQNTKGTATASTSKGEPVPYSYEFKDGQVTLLPTAGKEYDAVMKRLKDAGMDDTTAEGAIYGTVNNHFGQEILPTLQQNNIKETLQPKEENVKNSLQSPEKSIEEIEKELDGLDKKPGLTHEYRRVTELSVVKREDWPKVEAWFKKNLPNVPVQRVRQLLMTTDGGYAWGKFSQAGITLFEGAQEGTGYHEAFEAVWKLFVNPIEQKRILESFRKRKGTFVDPYSGKEYSYNDASLTDAQVKEVLADEFAQFVQNEGKISEKLKGQPFIIRLFRELWNTLKSLFASREEKLFEKINSGYYSTFPASIGTTIEQYSRVPSFDWQTQHQLMEQITSYVMSYFFGANKVINLTDLSDGKAIPMGYIYDTIKEQLVSDFKQKAKHFKDLGDKAAMLQWYQLAQSIEENWDTIRKINEQYLETFKIVKKERVSKDEAKEVDEKIDALEAEDDSELEDGDVSQDIKDESRNQKEYDRDIFTIDSKENASAAIKLLFATLRRVKVIQQQQTTFDGTSIPKLEWDLSPIGGPQFIDFGYAFNSTLSTLVGTQKLDNMIKKLAQRTKQDPALFDLIRKLKADSDGNLNYSTLSYEDWRLLLDFFKTMSKQRPNALVYYHNNGTAHLLPGNRYSAIQSLVRRFAQKVKNNNKVFQYNKEDKTYRANADFFKKFEFKKAEDYTKFLREIGMNADEKGNPVLTAPAIMAMREKDRRQFFAATKALHRYIQDGNVLYDVSSKTLQVEGPAEKVAKFIVSAAGEDVESTFFNIMGEKVQSAVLKNPYANFTNNFNEAQSLDALHATEKGLTGPFALFSRFLKKGGIFFDKEGNRTEHLLEVGYIDGTKNEKGPKQSARMSLIGRKLQHFNLNLQGWMIPITNGDKKTEWLINMGNAISYNKVATGAHWKETYDLFEDYFTAEVLSAQKDKYRNLANLKGREGKLRFFLDILSDVSSKFKEDIEAVIKGEQNEQAIRFVIEQHKEEFYDAVKTFLQNETQRTINEFKSYSIINAGEKGYTISGIDQAFIYDNINPDGKNQFTEKELNDTVFYRTVNSVINNIELHKIFFGDPAFMKDAIKRIPGAASGVEQPVFNNEQFNQFMNNRLNKTNPEDGVKLQASDLGFTQFSDDVSIMVFDEVRSKSADGHSIDEADAQSKMTLPAYREYKIRHAEWNNRQEEHYQWEMARLRQILAKAGKYTYSSSELKDYDEKLVKEYQPNSAVYEHIKPKGFSQSQDSDDRSMIFWKTAVRPLIPSVLVKDDGSMNNDGKLMLRLMQKGIKVAAVPSAIKIGVKETLPFYDKEGNFNEETYEDKHIVRLSWQDTGTQVETQFSQGKEKGTLGSQLTAMATMNLLDAGIPVDFMKEEKDLDKKQAAWDILSEEDKLKTSPVYAKVMRNQEILHSLIENGYSSLLEELGIQENNGKFTIDNYQAVLDYISTEARDLDDNTREALSLNEEGKFKIPLEAIPSYTQLKAVLYSIVDKRIASPKVSGGGYVQSSSWGMETESRGTHIMANHTHKWYTKEEPWIEISLPFWAYKKLANKYRALGKPVPTEEEMIKLINDSNGRVLEGIGFRIPTQEINSVEVFRVKSFLPQVMGNTVIVPSELVRKVGSDFDVDKLNTYLKNLIITGKGEIKSVSAFDSEQEAISYFEKEYTNDKISKLERIERFDDFRNRLMNIFKKIDSLQGQITDKKLAKTLSDDELEFYQFHQNLIAEMDEQAYDKDQTLTEYLQAQIDRLSIEKDELNAAVLNEDLKKQYVKRYVRKSLENAYTESLVELLQIPEVYDRLLTPNDASEFKKIRNDLNKALYTKEEIQQGNIETGDKNKPLSYAYLLSPNTLDEIRHNLITGKYGVGIAAIGQKTHSILQRTPVTLDMKRAGMLYQPGSYNQQMRAQRLGDGVIRFPHNTHKGLPTLSRVLDNTQKYISNKISQFVDGFVDVAKDTFIIEMGVNMRTAGTFLFMVRMGAPIKQVAAFMNQPVIREYFKALDKEGINGIFSSKVIRDHLGTWGVMEKGEDNPVTYKNNEQLLSADALLKQIEEFKAKGRNTEKMSKAYMEEQTKIFMEFLKYAEMAGDLFHLIQGLTWDTAHMSDPEVFFLKDKKYQKANRTLFTPASQILQKTFIGRVKDKLQKSRDAIGQFIALEHPAVRSVLERVKGRFVNDDFMPNDKSYSKLAQRVNNSFLNYILQVKGKYNTAIRQYLLDQQAGTAVLLNEAFKNVPKDSPFWKTLSQFEVVSQGKDEGAVQNVQLKRKPKDAYERNAFIAGLREMKEGPQDMQELYKALVRHTLIQNGVQMTPNSYSHLIPAEDYAQALSSLIQAMPMEPDLHLFDTVDAFYRNAWKTEAVPAAHIKAGYSENDNDVEPKPWAIGFTFFRGPLQGLRKFPKGSVMYYSESHEYLKYAPTQSQHKDSNNLKYNPLNGQFMNMRQARQKGSKAIDRVFLYKQVKDSKGDPLYVITNSKGKEYVNYIYKAINPWGDGSNAQEYYDHPRKSQIASNTFQMEQELNDADIEQAIKGNIVEITKQNGGNNLTLNMQTSLFPNEVIGNIKLNIIDEWVKTGRATSTVRSSSYHKDFYKGDGVYQSDKGTKVQITYKGNVKLSGNKIVGNDFSYTRDEFAKMEGWKDWAAFAAPAEKGGAQYAGRTLVDGGSVHMYSITPVLSNNSQEAKDKLNRKKGNCK